MFLSHISMKDDKIDLVDPTSIGNPPTSRSGSTCSNLNFENINNPPGFMMMVNIVSMILHFYIILRNILVAVVVELLRKNVLQNHEFSALLKPNLP